MKKFDLEAAKAGAAVCDAEGNPIRILCFDAQIPSYPIVGLHCVDGVDCVESYTQEGVVLYAGYVFERDLHMASIHHEAWANAYPNGKLGFLGHKSEERALNAANEGCIATIKIEWEE